MPGHIVLGLESSLSSGHCIPTDRLRLVSRAWWRWHLNVARRWARINAVRCCPSYSAVTELGHHKNAQLVDLVPQRIKICFDLGEITLDLATLNVPEVIILKLGAHLFELLVGPKSSQLRASSPK